MIVQVPKWAERTAPVRGGTIGSITLLSMTEEAAKEAEFRERLAAKSMRPRFGFCAPENRSTEPKKVEEL